MIRRPPMSTRTATLFPYTALFRSRREAIRSRPLSCCWLVAVRPGRRCRRGACVHEWWRGVLALIDSIFAAPAGNAPRARTGYRDIVLAFAAVTIISVMILPLPIMAIDTLVAVHIPSGFGLLLPAIFLPPPWEAGRAAVGET